jgi:hypothetical protein
MGIVVPEAIAAVTNQKRSPGLQMIGLGSVIFGFVLSRVVLQAFPLLLPLGGINLPLGGGIPLFYGHPFYLTQYTILWLVLALFLAYQRLK